MKFADSKDIKRAQDLGKHSGAVNSSQMEIARGKASSMAQAITDRRKILGRLEAVASVWNDYRVLEPFMEKCIYLWPNSQYSTAFNEGNNQGIYLKTALRSMGIPRDFLLNKCLINDETGTFITGQPYEFDEVARIIFNTNLKRKLNW
jgi:hypothetical protein